MLTAYENSTRQLIQALTSTVPLIDTTTLDQYINTARGQVAAEGECIRGSVTLPIVAGVPSYQFSNFIIDVTVVSAVVAVRSGNVGGTALDVRPWEWFAAYYLGKSTTGTPTIVAQQGQGTSGTLFFYPTPSASIPTGVIFDVVLLPVTLITDSQPEPIPYPWTDAVPFYAAWLGMMNAQRQADADMMFSRYEQIMMRLARQGATPSELPSNMPMDRGLRLQTGAQ